VVTRLIHVSGEWMESDFVLPITKRDPQAAGSAITYARRYALQALAGIPTADDDAEASMQRGEPEKTVEQWNRELRGSIDVIKESILCGDYSAGSEAWKELSTDEKQGIWVAPTKGGAFDTIERKIMQSTEFKNGDNIGERQ
jgi:hypothetical protein